MNIIKLHQDSTIFLRIFTFPQNHDSLFLILLKPFGLLLVSI